MRMNITIEGKQSDMEWQTQQRTKRCLKVLQDIGFDIKLDFTDKSDRGMFEYYRPLKIKEQPFTPIEIL